MFANVAASKAGGILAIVEIYRTGQEGIESVTGLPVTVFICKLLCDLKLLSGAFL
jgi:hypothetical protein